MREIRAIEKGGMVGLQLLSKRLTINAAARKRDATARYGTITENKGDASRTESSKNITTARTSNSRKAKSIARVSRTRTCRADSQL